jgi:hypothetical protein
LEIGEFERCINLGLGRAILHLQKHPSETSSESYRTAIFDACWYNTVYDRQLEHNRGQYMREIIRLTGVESSIRKLLFIATSKMKANWRDTSHRLDIILCFAKEGDKEAKELFYNIFDRTIKTNDVWCASRIIEFDGIDGFVYLAEKIVENQKETHDDFSHDSLLRDLEDQLGEEIVQAKLSELRTTNPKLDTYLKVLETYRASRQMKPHPSSTIVTKNNVLSYEKLKPSLKSWDISRLWRWGEDTDEDNLLKAAIDLEQESDRLLLRKYLAIFRYVPYPRSPQKLIALSSHTDTQISRQAFSALECIESREVREFALRLLAGETYLGEAVGLLKVNFEEDDWELIEAATEKALEPFENHCLQMNAREVSILHPSPKGVKSLLNLYEYGVCSHCRRYILENLASLDALPESIREECFYDSNPDIREWAKKGFPRESYKSLPERN